LKVFRNQQGHFQTSLPVRFVLPLCDHYWQRSEICCFYESRATKSIWCSRWFDERTILYPIAVATENTVCELRATEFHSIYPKAHLFRRWTFSLVELPQPEESPGFPSQRRGDGLRGHPETYRLSEHSSRLFRVHHTKDEIVNRSFGRVQPVWVPSALPSLVQLSRHLSGICCYKACLRFKHYPQISQLFRFDSRFRDFGVGKVDRALFGL
jgi:hypothetical protein